VRSSSAHRTVALPTTLLLMGVKRGSTSLVRENGDYSQCLGIELERFTAISALSFQLSNCWTGMDKVSLSRDLDSWMLGLICYHHLHLLPNIPAGDTCCLKSAFLSVAFFSLPAC
jgi:hypothetical protein